MSYGFAEQFRALEFYKTGMSKSEISRQKGMPSRPTITIWAKEGLPTEVTKGLDWDSYVEQENAVAMAEFRDRRLVEMKENDVEFYEQAQTDVRTMWELMMVKFNTGQFQATPGDLERVMNMYVKLNNQAADQLTEFKAFAKEVLRIIARHVVDQRLLDLIRIDITSLLETRRDRMGDVPGKVHHTHIAEEMEVAAKSEITPIVVQDVEDADFEDL